MASIAFATWYSGLAIAAGTAARVLLFGIGVYVFFYACYGPGAGDPLRFTRALFWIATAGALFACVDFYWQFPAPAGYGPQFVWLSDRVVRRAQGVFYEASTLGNFCVFFLVMIVVALFRPRGESPCSRKWLALGAVVFSTALAFSYSRGSVVNLLVALAVFSRLRRVGTWRSLAVLAVCMALAAVAGHFLFPALAEHYWSRLKLSLEYVSSAPNGVLSGRISTWRTLLDFIGREPWHAIFGIGYKTLPYSEFAGGRIVADNTYLSLLIETGIVGLAAFLAMNAAILRSALRAARSANARASFFGAWILCFWTGEMVQMLSGDLITYWRVLPLYFWVLAMAVREAGT